MSLMFTDKDSSQATKGAVHGAVFTLAVLCAAYNLCAWRARGESHLKLNTVVYTALALFEVWQVRRHCQ